MCTSVLWVVFCIHLFVCSGAASESSWEAPSIAASSHGAGGGYKYVNLGNGLKGWVHPSRVGMVFPDTMHPSHNPWVPKDGKPPVNDESLATHLMELQHGACLEAEHQSRIRNEKMTPQEQVEASAMKSSDPRWNKVLLNFGCPGGMKSAQAILLDWTTAADIPPGRMCSAYSPQFTLLKHMLVKGINFDLKGSGCIIKDRTMCFCFPETSLMAAGCIHHKKHLSTINFWPNSLCATCSVCAKCSGFLV